MLAQEAAGVRAAVAVVDADVGVVVARHDGVLRSTVSPGRSRGAAERCTYRVLDRVVGLVLGVRLQVRRAPEHADSSS